MIRKISLTASVLTHAAVLTAFIILHLAAPKNQKQDFVVEKYEDPIEEDYQTPPLEEPNNLPEEYISYSEKNTISPVPEQQTASIDEEIIRSMTPNLSYFPNKLKGKIKEGLLKGFGDGRGKIEGLSSGNILGDNISAKKLGVILDISSSMAPYIEDLEKDIRKGFKNYSIERIDGCELVTSGSPTLTAMRALSSKNVDAIYWFCDLQDKQTPVALVYMSKYFEKKNIKLYIKSLDKAPNFYLVKIVNKSGGQVL